MFWTGYRRFLSLDTLYAIDADLSSRNVELAFAKEWTKQPASSRWGLLAATFASVRWTVLAVIMPRLCLSALKLSQPLLIGRVTRLLSEGLNDNNRDQAKGLIGAAALIYVGVAITTALFQRELHRMLTKIRGSIVSAVYAKLLKLDTSNLADSAALTLVTADVNRVCSSLKEIDNLFATPIEVAVAIFLLERQIGVSCIAPVALAVTITVISFMQSNTAISMQKSWLAAVSARVAYTSSVLGSPKGFKMLGLTDYFIEKIQALRVLELGQYAQYRKYVTWRNVFSVIPTAFAPPLTLTMFVLIQGREALDPTVAFTTLALVALLTGPVQEMIHAVPALQTALASLDRVQAFLRLESSIAGDATIEAVVMSMDTANNVELSALPTKGVNSDPEVLVHLSDASVEIGEKSVLQHVNLSIRPRSLNMVVGVVGSGKSTLLKVIIDDQQLSSGTRHVKSDTTFSYCAQDAWLPNDTVRNIVIGHSDYDDKWLSTVIQACALSSDIRSFSTGDATLVGAKGVTLSGGQRQRLALARALYSRHKILIADDVFSGLDANTSKQLFSQVFSSRGLCRTLGMSVVLATHSQNYLPEADHVIAIGEAGTITEQGSYDELVTADGYVRGLNLTSATGSQHQEAVIADILAKQAVTTTVDKLELAQQDLARKTGDTAVYKYYLKSMGWKLSIIQAICVVGFGVADRAPDLWFRFWSQAEASGNQHQPLGLWIGVSFLIAAVFIACTFVQIWVMLVIAVPKSSAQLHKQLLDTVMHATYSFFVNTDPGMTLNRFSNDMSIIEGELTGAVMQFTGGLAACIVGGALIVAGADYAAAALPFVMIVLYMIQKFYLRTSRQMRFLELESSTLR